MNYRLENTTLEGVVDGLGVGVIVVDGDLRLHLWNRWMAEGSGLKSEEALGRTLEEVFVDVDFKVLRRKVRQVLALGNNAFFDARTDGPLFPLANEQRLCRRFSDMQLSCVLKPIRCATTTGATTTCATTAGATAPSELVSVTVIDVTTRVTAEVSLEEANAQLEYRNRYDGLTQLLNRAAFFELLERELRVARRYAVPVSLVMIDVDFFKQFNDRYGHQVGDRALQAVARALRDSVRETDFVGRYGGEEFIAALPNTPLEAAYCLAERLRLAVASNRVPVEGGEVSVTISLGVAESDKPHDSDDLLQRADASLYEAKRQGRDRIGSAPNSEDEGSVRHPVSSLPGGRSAERPGGGFAVVDFGDPICGDATCDPGEDQCDGQPSTRVCQ